MDTNQKVGNWIFSFTCLILLGLQITKILKEPTAYLSSNLQLAFTALVAAALLNSVFSVCLWRRQNNLCRYLGRGLLVLFVLLYLLTSFLLYQEMGLFAFLIALAILLVYCFAVIPVLRQKLPVSDAALDSLAVLLIVVVTLSWMGMDTGSEKPMRPADETYSVTLEDGTIESHQLYHDELPLTLEDLQPDQERVSTTLLEHSSSVAMDRTVCYQNAVPDELYQLDLCYEIMDMKLPGVAAICKNPWQDKHRLFGIGSGWHQFWLEHYQQLELSDAAGAKVYQFYDENNQLRREYLLCWPARMVLLHYHGELGEQEWKIILEKLVDRKIIP